MKSTIIFKQGFNEIKIGFEFGKTKAVSKLVGTACNELFELIDLQKEGVTKMFKLSQPIDLAVIGEGFEVDTSVLSAEYRTNLKINSSIESKVRFAKRVFKLVNHINRERKVLDIKDIEALLD